MTQQTVVAATTGSWSESSLRDRLKTDPAFHVFWTLRVGLIVLPILMGADEFAPIRAARPALR